MAQKVNGETILTKVLEYADRKTVEQAIATGQSIRLTVASYNAHTERTGVFELEQIHNLHDTPDGGFTFSGHIVDGGVYGVTIDKFSHRGYNPKTDNFSFVGYDVIGKARVTVGRDGARVEFSLKLSFGII